MKTNSGDVITQFDLHECEDVSLIKVDLLATEGMDKIYTCLKDCLKSILKFSKDGRTTILFLDLYKQTVEHLKSLGYIIEIEYEKDDCIYNVSWEDSMEVCKIDE